MGHRIIGGQHNDKDVYLKTMLGYFMLENI